MYHVVLLLRRGLYDLKFQISINFTKSEICSSFAFCHACLNLLIDELAVAQCYTFAKNLVCIPAMYFVVMFGCCSMFISLLLDAYLP